MFQLGRDGVAIVVYGVIATPQDAVVVGQPVVVKLVGGVEQALPAAPAERRHLLRRQRLGHQHVVVHGGDVAADGPDQRREAVGGQHDPLGPQPATRRRQHHAVGQLVQRRHRRQLVQAHAQLDAGAAKTPCQAGRVDQRGAAPLPDAAQVGGRVDLRAHLVLAEPVAVVAVLPHHRHEPAQLLDLVLIAGDQDRPRPLPAAVDAVALDRLLDAVQVLAPQPLQLVDLVGEPAEAVGQAMGQGRIGEPAVAAACACGDRRRLQHHDVAGGIVLLGLQRRPQAREAAADHGQRAAALARERVGRGRGERRVQPEGAWRRLDPGGAAHEGGSRIW